MSDTVIDIVRVHLVSIGADGLVNPGMCGCELGDLAPCDGPMGECRPGWKGALLGLDGEGDGESGEWAMYTTREAAEASKSDKEQA